MRLTTLVTAMLLATGCMGGVDEQDPPTPTPDGGTPATGAKALFKSSVHTVVIAKCSGAGCHQQPGAVGIYGFAAADAESSYTQVTSQPTLVGTYTAASARLLSKIDGSHYAVTYSADDTSKITAWLSAELSERNANGQPPVDPIAKLAQWSGCMSLINFQEANMAQAWGQLAAQNLQRCANCHAGGAYAFMSGAGGGQLEEQTFFTTITTQKDLLLKYFTVDAMGNVIINNAAFKNAGVDLPPDTDHPIFNPTTNAGMTALTEFYDLTKARLTANTCDPPRLPTTP